jgi:hypothetical protein
MGRYIVTSPHSFCDNVIKTRHCDTVALQAGDHIVTALNASGVHNVVYHPNINRMRFPSDVNGTTNFTGDYNRPETNGTEWRDQLVEYANAALTDFVFEVHSFPGDHPIYKSLWPDADLVLFKSKWNAHIIKRIMANIKKHNPSHNNIQIREPTHPVSITDDMGPHANVRGHCLIEFNEAMPFEDRKKMASAVTAAILDIDMATASSLATARSTTQMYKKIIIRVCIALLIIGLVFIVLVYSSDRLLYHLLEYMYPLAYHPHMQ